MLPSEEHKRVKRKHEDKKAAEMPTAESKQVKDQDYNASTFANAIHGMPPTLLASSPPNDWCFRMKATKQSSSQPRYMSKKRCRQVAVPHNQSEAYFKPPPTEQVEKYARRPLPRVVPSNYPLRQSTAFRGSGLTGKAGEVLGATNKYACAAPKQARSAAKEATKSGRLSEAVRDAAQSLRGQRPAKTSSSCTVM
ncbi:uncharacterized protein PV09_07535 [Verruconis gallopava]|uniref:Uncharacterized protein n=1 Tax=Verruconis gallopava TaxID=253628 RepID=A0A0D2A2R5_9PEZI|nr:uncharacterized protein PV09_07535 [Verruconis gallopava]KIW01018.1 hypothetical protein PV09_07535 [Verruconis gallopava]